jgi:hypothetical protein
MFWDLKLFESLGVHSSACLVVVVNKLQLGCNYFFNPIFFLLVFKFVKYILQCTKIYF